MQPKFPAVQSVTRQSANVPPSTPISTPEGTYFQLSDIRPWATVASRSSAPSPLMRTTVLNGCAA